jgi:HPt (histidine-containing phosphotransfer) domain-containing protein
MNEAVPIILDLSNLIETSMGDKDFIADMIDMFSMQGTTQLNELRDLCVNGFSKEWVEKSHALKGTAAMIGAIYMRELCGQAQKMDTADALAREKIHKDISVAFRNVCDQLIGQGYKIS